MEIDVKHTSIKLIAVSYPSQANLWDVVERDEIIIARDTMNRLDAYLLQSSKEVLTQSASAQSHKDTTIPLQHRPGS